jgi:uncharacterized membrane protein
MEFEFLNRVAFFLQVLALVIWIGGSILISIIIAPLSFKIFATRENAVNFIGQILERFDYFVIISIFLFMIGILIEIVNSAKNPILRPQYQVHLIIFSTMTLLAAISRLVVRPLMKTTKKKIDMLKLKREESPFEKRFAFYHGLSLGIFIVNIFLGLVLIFINQF